MDVVARAGGGGDRLPPVIVTVHGTNDADLSEEGARWWQRGSDFTVKLREALKARGIGAVEIAPVRWSGANSDHDRLEGARRLARVVDALRRQGRRYAIIGHSHGGNVTLEALGRARTGSSLAGIVTFGTPFFVRRLKRLPLLIASFQVLLGVAMTPLMVVFFYLYTKWVLEKQLYAKLVEPVVVFGGIGAATAWALYKGISTLTRNWRSKARIGRSIEPNQWLVVHSPRDEAMRLLETAAVLSPTFVTPTWGVRSLSRLATVIGVAATIVFFVLTIGYFSGPIRQKVMAGEFTLGTAADLTFLLILPVVYLIVFGIVWLAARLGGGWLYASAINHFISGGIIGAAYGGDASDHLVRVERTPPALRDAHEVRIEALHLGGIDDRAIFESARDIYDEIVTADAVEGGFGDPDKMWKLLSDALYHNAYMRDDGVIAVVADHLAPGLT